MMNILYEPFPNSITADGAKHEILTDFREWLRFADLIADAAVDAPTKLLLLTQWFIVPPPHLTADMVIGLFDFFHAKALEPDPLEQDENDVPQEPELPHPPVFDWKYDARFLLGDFLHFYGMNLLQVPYLHWWEFRSLFSALPDDSMTAKRIGYRSADLSQIKDPAQRARIARIQKAIALPFEFDDEMIGALLWNT